MIEQDGVKIAGPTAVASTAGGDPVDLTDLEVTAASLGLGVHVLELVVDDGKNTAIDDIEVSWSDGSVSEVSAIDIDERIVVVFEEP